jgi:asparagine synthase (glutamine-hydrolysing)
MLDTMRHRGPDSDGILVRHEDGLVLGHRRLAIQDLSEQGSQPMFSKSGRYCVVFNGEIYNFKELASELQKLGCVFRGHSDSEVLLEAIDEWGLIKALDKFVGMFAFGLWDTKEKLLHLCRDRIGEKPLYYGSVGRKFYFASELKAIESVVDKSCLMIDRVALNGFLRYGYINSPHSIYQNFYKLLPGTVLTLGKSDISNAGTLIPVPYWRVSGVVNEGLLTRIDSESDAIDQLDTLLQDTIRRQMIADVNIGTFLSGGIDSTLVSAIAQSLSKRRVNTFTIGFLDKEYDESVYAEKIANHIGSDHHTVYVSPRDALNVIPELSTIYDEPFADSSQIPTYLVSKIAKQKVTVCLSGDGGDELFSGYNRYMWLAHIWGRIKILPLGIRKIAGKILSIPSPALWDKLHSILATTQGKQDNCRLLGLKLQKLAGLIQCSDIRGSYDYLVSYWDQPGNILQADYRHDCSNMPRNFPVTDSFIEEAMFWDQVSYLPGDNLAKVDRASMSVSLEARLPLLSHEVIEYSWRLPLSFKVKQNTGKWILRQVLDRYVPNQLMDRPKMGFSVPISDWLRQDLKEWAEDMLFSKSIIDAEVFQMDALRQAWNEHLSGKSDYSHRLWAVLMFISWRFGRM